MLLVLTPIWHALRNLAVKVRDRLGAIMKWSMARGYPNGY